MVNIINWGWGSLNIMVSILKSTNFIRLKKENGERKCKMQILLFTMANVSNINGTSGLIQIRICF